MYCFFYIVKTNNFCEKFTEINEEKAEKAS